MNVFIRLVISYFASKNQAHKQKLFPIFFTHINSCFFNKPLHIDQTQYADFFFHSASGYDIFAKVVNFFFIGEDITKTVVVIKLIIKYFLNVARDFDFSSVVELFLWGPFSALFSNLIQSNRMN